MDYTNVKADNARERPKKQAIVADGLVTKKNSSELAKDATNFKDVMIKQVLIPAAQRTVMELVRATCQEFTRAIEKRIFGREIFGDSLFSYGPLDSAPKRNYSKISTAGLRDPYTRDGYRVVERRGPGYEVKQLMFKTHDAAKSVYEALLEDIDQLKMVSVGEYYEYCGESPDYTDYKWGWRSLPRAHAIIPTRDGKYMLDLPTPKPITI